MAVKHQQAVGETGVMDTVMAWGAVLPIISGSDMTDRPTRTHRSGCCYYRVTLRMILCIEFSSGRA